MFIDYFKGGKIMAKFYELSPIDGRKSFYSKALVEICNDGTEVLYSYGTKIISRIPDGSLVRYWDGWSLTTGRHIKAFCGLSKSDFLELPVTEE